MKYKSGSFQVGRSGSEAGIQGFGFAGAVGEGYQASVERTGKVRGANPFGQIFLERITMSNHTMYDKM